MTTVRAPREDFSVEKMIEMTQGDARLLLLRSLICGASLGVIYDVFRFLKLFCGVKYGEVAAPKSRFLRVLHFFLAFVTDIAFWSFVGIVSVALIYSSTRGMFRGLTYIGLALGFIAYYFTLGRLVLFLSRKAVKILWRVMRFAAKVVRVPISFIFKGIISLYHLTIGKIIGKIISKIRTKKNKPESETEQEPECTDGGGKEDFVYVEGKIGYRRTDRINFGNHLQRN